MADVTIYEHWNFEGQSQVLPKGRYDDALQQLTIGNDTLSSLKVPQGLVARLYEHYHFQGRFIDIKEDTPVMSQFWNDRISSIIVYGEAEPPPVIQEVLIYEDANYGGKFQILQPGKYDVAQLLIGNDTLSSALVPYGMVLRLYEDANFQGAFLEIREDTLAVSLEWNDRASSLIVYEAAIGLWKISNANAGIIGESSEFNGVRGISHAAGHGADAGGVVGVNDNTGPGVFGQSTGTGIVGESKGSDGILGTSTAAGKAGVAGVNENGGNGLYGRGNINGVWGHCAGQGYGVVGVSDGGAGVYGKGGRLAGFFEGDVEVTGDIRLTNADCAEEFDICDTELSEPGTVMVVGEEGVLFPSQHPYDKRVAGVVSGAGEYKPGIVLDKQQSERKRQPIALLGKVFCKVDAQYGAIALGDLLTTSPTRGHAMKADDPSKAFGAVIGKALRPLKEGQELIPILIALQ